MKEAKKAAAEKAKQEKAELAAKSKAEKLEACDHACMLHKYIYLFYYKSDTSSSGIKPTHGNRLTTLNNI